MGSVDEAENKTLFKLEEDAKQSKEASLMEQGSLSPTFLNTPLNHQRTPSLKASGSLFYLTNSTCYYLSVL